MTVAPPSRQNAQGLFPLIEPFNSGFMQGDDVHNIYWEECGNPHGDPILFLHGGPGGAISPTHRRFYDPRHFRIILHDQRGCGKSTPLGCLENNTTENLIGDIEKLREMLGIEKWHVIGGSWGSTLALAYAQTHPTRCKSMILRGIFLMRPVELDWFVNGIQTVFPEIHEEFISILSEAERENITESYYKRMTTGDIRQQIEASKKWCQYEGSCATLMPTSDVIASEEQERKAWAMGRLEAHYFLHNQFTPHDALLRNIDRIRHIPATILQGRYDMICPVQTAHDLHKAWPEAHYVIIPDAGHSVMDPALLDATLKEIENLKNLR